ncbi:DUF4267 domain-containing protein [Nocardioides sp. NPDC101246]|uniref:DUF4267 domain-containing protein n=1 Tax=Nocardioides sp. NPDC101246 TaxID=3364336 RepID=UPI00380EF2CE
MLHTIGLTIVWIVVVMIVYVGVMYLLKNEPNGKGFGIPVLPAPDARAWWQVKGARDIGTGLLLVPLIFLEPDALPWVVLVEAMIPFSDMLIILGAHGSKARAFGIHGLTAALMLVAVVLLWVG